MGDIAVGSKVRLHTPDNPRLHGAVGRVVAVTSWGAHVKVRAAASGRYRALNEEMVLDDEPFTGSGNGSGYTGDVCSTCNSLRMRRNGTCLVCDDCGATSGCS